VNRRRKDEIGSNLLVYIGLFGSRFVSSFLTPNFASFAATGKGKWVGRSDRVGAIFERRDAEAWRNERTGRERMGAAGFFR